MYYDLSMVSVCYGIVGNLCSLDETLFVTLTHQT